MNKNAPVTELLAAWRSGDEQALQQLTPVIYNSLRRLSAKHLSGEKNLSIQATELVHEAYLNLIDVEIDWQNRAHFFAVASRLIRRMLIDRARAKQRQKRGGEFKQVDTDIERLAADTPEKELLDLHYALEQLNSKDPRKSEVLELHFFGGLTYKEIATVLDISEATVDRDLRFAKAWIYSEIHQTE